MEVLSERPGGDGNPIRGVTVAVETTGAAEVNCVDETTVFGSRLDEGGFIVRKPDF